MTKLPTSLYLRANKLATLRAASRRRPLQGFKLLPGEIEPTMSDLLSAAARP